jgi:hypothetical protein
MGPGPVQEVGRLLCSQFNGIRDDLYALPASQEGKNLSEHDRSGPRDDEAIITRKLPPDPDRVGTWVSR